jgi:hypothetical protein
MAGLKRTFLASVLLAWALAFDPAWCEAPPDGQRFQVGSGLTDALRRQPPPIGTRITYRYQHLTKSGLPRFPRYLRVREDF